MFVVYNKKWKTQEARLQNQIDLLQNYKNELLKATNSQQIIVNEKNQANKEANEMKQKFSQLQRSEKMLKVDLEQTKIQVDLFISNSLNNFSSFFSMINFEQRFLIC